MKLVIEIPNEVYAHAKDVENRLLTPNEESVLRESVVNGTPLPKGHGRIIDESKIEVCEWVDAWKEDYPKASTDAPTIIEGDN